MDIIHAHILKHLGMAIFHSIWQIGVVAFIYIVLLLAIKKRNIKLSYASGLICLFIILISFLFTFLSLNKQIDPSLLTSLENISDVTTNNMQVENWFEEGIFEKNNVTEYFGLNFQRIKQILYQIAGAIGIIWLFGILFHVFKKLKAYLTLKKIKLNKHNVRSTKWEFVLMEISTKLKLKKHIDILFSPFVNAPFSFGFINPIILFPLKITTGLSSEEIKCILIHELAHNLRNDYIFNIFQNVIEVLFFYHPGVLWISAKIRTQREILCDKIVTDTKISKKVYVNSLIKLKELQVFDSNLAVAAKQNNNELLTRIKHIVSKPDIHKRKKNNLFVIAALAFIFIVSGFTFHTRNNLFNSSDIKKKIESNLAPYQGSFTLYDFKQDKYYAFNDSICQIRYPAYSTFKIASSLIAFDIGIAKSEFYTIQYDSLKHPLPDWMKNNEFFKNWYLDHNIKSALKYSVNWFFMELGASIGNSNMLEYMSKLNYGNKKVTSGRSESWLNGELKISAIEQVEIIKNLFNKDFKNISPEAHTLTIKAFPKEKTDNYSLYGKTGTGEVSDDKYIGWLIGCLVTNSNSYPFAINIFADDINNLSWKKRQQMVKNIFTDLKLINN